MGFSICCGGGGAVTYLSLSTTNHLIPYVTVKFQMRRIEINIGRFHFKNHIDKWCKANMNPADSVYLKDVNTEIMEQTFAWLRVRPIITIYEESELFVCSY